MRLSGVVCLALVSTAPAWGQSLSDYRNMNTVAGQRTELIVRIQLRAAERWINKHEVDKAVDCLNKAKDIVDSDTSLSDSRHRTLLRVIKDRLRVAQAPADPVDQGTLEKQATEDIKRREAEHKSADDKKIQQQLANIRALQKEGKRDDARKLTKELAKEYPDRHEITTALRNADILDQLVSARQFQRQKTQRFDRAMTDVERSAIPPSGDIEFNVKYWKERVQKRAKNSVKYSAKELAILRALNSPVTVKFKDSHFDDVIDYLRTMTNVPIIVDPDSKKKAEIDDETPVSIDAKGLSLRTVLRFILTSHGLSYVVKDEVIEIVTQEKAKTMLTTRAYPVGDLVHTPGFGGMFFGPQVENFQMMQNVATIIDMIQSSVDPDSWKANGGLGTITFNAATMSIVIRNSAEVQAQIGTGGLLGH